MRKHSQQGALCSTHDTRYWNGGFRNLSTRYKISDHRYYTPGG